MLPAIVLAEAAFVVERGRTGIPDVAHLLASIKGDPRIEVALLTHDVVAASFTAPASLELHDRLIVGTALHLQQLGHPVALVTKDEDIKRTAAVPVVW